MRGWAALIGVTVLVGCGSTSTAKSTTTTTPASPTTLSPTTVSSTTVTAGASATTAAGTATTHGVATATTAAVSSATIQLTDKDKGSTRSVARGTTIVVVLSSIYWQFPNPPDPAVLQQEGPTSVMPSPFGTCVPGGGCGTASATYKAVGTGPAQISASRTTCGEVRSCLPAQASYAVQVVVAG